MKIFVIRITYFCTKVTAFSLFSNQNANLKVLVYQGYALTSVLSNTIIICIDQVSHPVTLPLNTSMLQYLPEVVETSLFFITNNYFSAFLEFYFKLSPPPSAPQNSVAFKRNFIRLHQILAECY